MSKQCLKTILLLAVGLPLCAVSSPEEINRALHVTPDMANGKKLYALCASCHLDNGWGKPDGSFPVIAGQHRSVLIKQLADIRAKNRQNPTMYPFTDPAAIGGVQAISDVTAYIASLPPDPSPGQGDGQQLAHGKEIFQQQCAHCHGAQGQGNEEAFYPRLKGQHYAYLVRQLKWIRDGYRANANPAMVVEVSNLKDSDLEAVADYISRL
jgi:cytochrome c553